jgi:hypothetical protein
MTHLLHSYISDQLVEHLNRRRVVVWYDSRSEFAAFISELGGDVSDHGPREVVVDGMSIHLATHDGSQYSVRARIEHLVSGGEPRAVVVYLAGVSRDDHGSVLMELELAGTRWEPQLKQLARNALRRRFTDGVVDELLDRQQVTYQDLVTAAGTEGGSAPSVLKSLLKARSADLQLAAWLADPTLDDAIVSKEAQQELGKLVEARLGLQIEGEGLAKWRSVTGRFVLAVEFRADLKTAPPRELDGIPQVTSEIERNARTVAEALRAEHADAYPALADDAARELGLEQAPLDALALGAIDTFRFEEVALLARCGELIRAGEYAQVCGIAAIRASSYWLRESIERQTQWEALRLAADLGRAADEVEQALAQPPTSPRDWIEAYAATWHRLDQAQRHLEAWLPKLEGDPDEQALAAVRRRYDAVLDRLAHDFVGALEGAGWAIEGAFHQTSIFDDVVAKSPGRVAYFLVDAMRYEMGVELAERLARYAEVSIRPAVGVLPSITKLGMAALMPGALASYDVVESGGKLVARVGGIELADRQARTSRIKALVPGSVDVELGEVHGLSKSKLQTKIGDAELVVVRSQEIDFFGEAGFQARSTMDTTIENLARAVRRLASLGIDRAIIASDHGHLYAADDRDEAMRTDAPGGAQTELHRRCWIGRGGATPEGCVRVPALTLGNETDLDFVFPRGIGVFKSGGDLAYHHGGASLQELVIPVIAVRSKPPIGDPAAGSASLAVSDVPATITNRIFSVKIAVTSLLGGDLPIKPVLLSDQRPAGHVGLAVGGQHDRATGTVVVGPTGEVTIGFVLDDDHVTSVRIVVVDPATDAPLYRSPTDIPVQLGVH